MQRYIVIDDDSTSNLICEFTIKKFDKDAGVDIYEQPERALESITKEFLVDEEAYPVILFLDVNMPTMSGFEFLDEFKKLPTQIMNLFTIFMLTSSIEDFAKEKKLYPFVSGFLSKPLKISDLQRIAAVHEERLEIKDL